MESRQLTVSEFKKRLVSESEKKKILLAASIEITSSCCFKCPHCYIDNATNGYMQLKTFEHIIDELKSLGCVYLTLTGGEALLHPNFREIYLKAYNSGFLVSLFSNGYLLNNYIDLLSANKPYEVDISLYGIDKETYYQYAGVPDGERVFDNLSLLKQKNITFSLKAAVTKKILPLIDQMRIIAKQYNATFRTDLYMYMSPEQAKSVERLTPSEIANELLKNKQYVELEKEALNKCPGELLYGCKPGETNVYITWDGLVKMCPFASDEHSYRIMDCQKTIQNARDFLQVIGQSRLPKDIKCHGCEYISTCRRCPERFYIETGNYSQPPSWMCETAKLILDGIQ